MGHAFSGRDPIDGSAQKVILLQIFTRSVIGPTFFEIIQRKGNEGFREENCRPRFEFIMLDQERRRVIRGRTGCPAAAATE